MDKIIAFSVKNKFIILLFILGLISCGIYALRKLPIDALPDITNNQVQVISIAPTLAAQEVEQYVTTPIETVVTTIPKLIELRSISRFGLSVITLVFEEDMDIYLARQLIDEKLKEAKELIPEGLGNAQLAPLSTGLGEIYQYVIKPKTGYETRYSPTELRTIQDWIVRKQLLGIPGVAEVSTLGGMLKQYEVALNPAQLKNLSISITDIYTALQNNNENTGASYIDKKPNAYFIRGLGLIRSVEDIENTAIKTVAGIPIYIRDIAKVVIGSANRYGALTMNGEGEDVGGMVLMLKSENSLEVTERVKQRIREIEKSLPEGLVIESFIDREKLVDNTISTIKTNLLEGALIVVFVLILLLGNYRAGLIVASVIPLSLLFAVSMMYFFNVSGNLMSLGAIDFGLVVDGAVIIVESILHRLYTQHDSAKPIILSQNQLDNEITLASQRIRKSAAFGEIIILIVYLPILSLAGVEGKMFRPMAFTVGFAILGAFILSLTYVPMISSVLLSKKIYFRLTFSDRLIRALQQLYTPVLKAALRIKVVVIGIVVIIFLLSIYTLSQLGGEFIPTLEEGDLAINIRIKPGSSLSQTIETTTKLETILKGFPEVEKVVSKIGSAEIPTDPMPMESADVIVSLKPKDQWTTANDREVLVDKMEHALAVIPGVGLEFSQPVQLRFNELITGVRSDIAIKIYGNNLDSLTNKANELARLIEPIAGVEDLRVEQIQGLPQIIVDYDRSKIAQYGLSIKSVNEVLQTAFAGKKVGVIFEEEKRFDLVLRLPASDRQDIEDIKKLYLTTNNGTQIPIGQVADISYQFSAMQISREGGNRRITVGLNVRNRDIASVIQNIQDTLQSRLVLPTGYRLSYGGQFENLQAAKNRLVVAVPVALLLILILLYFTFRSLKQMLLIFSAIPLSAIGGIFALWLRDMPFSISAGIGFIALFGVAVLNGIVLIAHFNELEKAGVSNVYKRIINGTRTRLRPVVMTAMVASLGFLPMALSTSSGAEVQRPLATVVIGGLISATLLTLLVLPVLYSLFFKSKPMIPTKVLLSAFLLTSIYLPSQAQQITSIDQAIEITYQRSLELESLQKDLEMQMIRTQQSFKLPSTSFGVEYGQYNSAENRDLAFSINQSIPFPSIFGKMRALNIAQTEADKRKLAHAQFVIKQALKALWLKGSYLNTKKQLLKDQSDLMTELARGTSLQYETGEVNYLEKVNASSYRDQAHAQTLQIDQEIAQVIQQLHFYVGDEPTIVLPSDAMEKNLLSVGLRVTNYPEVYYLEQLSLVKQKKIDIEKNKRLPSFDITYTNQSLNEPPVYNLGDRFSYVGLGLSIPLFNKQRKDVTIAQLQAEQQKLLFTYRQNQLESQFAVSLKDLAAQEAYLDYFEQTALKQADEIQFFAKRNYEEGEITQIEYLQFLNRALNIRFDHLAQLYQYNQTILQLESISN